MRAAWLQRSQAAAALSDHAAPQGIDWTGLAKPLWLRDVGNADEFDRAGGLPHVVVLTVDHGLRAASADEARLVCSEAEKLGLSCAVLKWEGGKPATGVQDAARNARRDLMCDVLRAERGLLSDIARARETTGGFIPHRRLAMAHHQGDQAETFLMRLARGSGLEGLGGIKPSSWIERAPTAERPASFQVAVERPLLDVPKERLVATLQSYGARWVDDPSNEDERFERVRVRKMMPLLAELGLSAEKIALSARRLRDAEMAVDRLLRADAKGSIAEAASAVRAEVDLSNAREFISAYTAVRALKRLLAAYGGGARRAELAQVEQVATQAVDWKAREGIGSLTLGGCKIECHGEGGRWLRIYREGAGVGLPVIPILAGQSVDWDGRRFTVRADQGAISGAAVRALGMQGWAELKKVVPEIARLKWPAAAAATLPVIERHGRIVAYVGIQEALAGERETSGDVLAAWKAFAAEHEKSYRCTFAGICEL